MLKNTLTIILLFIFCFHTKSSAITPPLNPGDLAIVGINNKGASAELAIVALKTISTGTVINVTDRAWETTNTFFNTTVDGVVTLTTTQVIPAGTVFNLFITGGSTPSASNPQNFGNIAFTGWSGPNIAGNAGDSWLIYTGTDQAPQFVYGLANWSAAKPGGIDPDPITGWTNNNVITGTTSNLPDALKSGPYYSTLTITGQNFFLYNAYNGPFIGSKDFLLNNIQLASNWRKSAGTALDLRPIDGNAFTGIQPIFTLTAAAPATISSVTTSTTNGDYNVGKVISLLINFTAPVNVIGTPTLQLNSTGTAMYSGGSGTSSLTFTYVVQAGENTAKLDYKNTSALTLIAAAIKDLSENSANTALPAPGTAGSLGANSNIVVNTNAPTVSSITRYNPTTATTSSNTLKYMVTFSEPVTGVDVTDFSISHTGTLQPYIANLDGTGATFFVTVSLVPNAGSGTVKLNLMNGNTGIQNIAGTPIKTDFTAGELYTIDLSPAILDQITMVSNNTTNNKRAITGNTITLSYNSSKPVIISSAMIYGFSTVVNQNPSGGWQSKYTFNGTEPEGPVPFEINFIDPTRNNLTIASTVTDASPVIFDKTPPTISSISYTSDLVGKPTFARFGNRVTLTGTFSEPVSGPPLITIAGQNIIPTMLSSVNFTADYYLIRGAVQEGILPFTINFQDAAGNNAAEVSNVSTGKNITLDESAPALTELTINSNNPNPRFAKAGDLVTVSFSATEPIGTSMVLVNGSSVAGSLSANKMTWTGTLPITSGSLEGLMNLFITFEDLIGNVGLTALHSTDGSTVQVDITPPANPNFLSVTPGNKQNKISWFFDPDVAKYELIGGEPVALGTNVLTTITAASATNPMSFTQTGLSNLTPYYYALRLSDAAGNSTTSPTAVGTPVNSQVITFDQPQAAEYGSSFTINATSSSGLPVILTSGDPLIARISGNTVTIVGSNNQKSVSIIATQPGDAVYSNAEPVIRIVQIIPKPTTIAAQPATKIYGGNEPGLSATFHPGLINNDSILGGSIARAPGEDVGTYVIDVSYQLDPNKYAVTYTTANFTITKKPITITSAASYNKTFNRPDPAMLYTTAPSIPGNVLTGNIGRIPGEDVGSYALTLGDLSAGPNYELTMAPGQNFMISPLAINVTPIGRNKTYGDPDPGFSYHYSPGIRPVDAFTGTPGRSPGESVGLYTINQGTLELSQNYILLFSNPTGASLTITTKIIDINPTVAQGKTYGDQDGPILYTANPSLLNGDTFSGALGRVAGTDVGNYLINNSNLSISNAQNAANYMLRINPSNEVYAISKKTVTILASPAQKAFGSTDPLSFSFHTSPTLLPGNTFSGRLERIPGEATGDYNIEQGSLAIPSGNYNINYVGAKFSITEQQLTITPKANLAKVYSENDPAMLGYDISPNIPGISLTGSLSRTPGEDVGLYDFNLGTLSAGSGYNLVLNTTPKFSISKKTINVNAVAKTKTYGDLDPILTYTFSPGLKLGDSFTGGLSRAAGESANTYIIGKGDLALNSNYTLNYTAADFTIGLKTINVNAVAKTKTYGDMDPALTYTFSPGLKLGDSFTGGLSRAAGESANTYTIGKGDLAVNSNYTLNYTPADFTIGLKTINVNAVAKTKTYGDLDPALTYTFSPGLKLGDSFTGGLSRAAGENVDTYTIGKGDLAINSNYTLNYTAADFTIGLKTINVNAVAKTKTYGDLDPALTYTFSPGLKSGDSFTGGLLRAAGENVNTYIIGKGDLALNSNYTLNYTPANFTIGLKTINVNAVAKTKTYGDLDPALTYTFSPGLKLGDSFTGGLSRAAGESANTYIIGKGDLALSTNYFLNYTTADFTIGTKTINVNAVAKTKTYGDLDPALTYTFSPGLKLGDSFTGGLSRAAGESANTYIIGKGDLALSTNYILNYTTADFTIGTKTINVNAVAKTKTYGDLDPALTYTFSPGLKLGDSFTGGLSRAAGESANTYTIGKGDLALNSNYTLNYTPADFTIGLKTINVNAVAKTKTYGDMDPALTYTFSPGLKLGDSFTGGLSRAAGENVNTYVIGKGDLALNSNYILSYIPTNFTIGLKTINVNAVAKTKTYGEVDPALTYAFSPGLKSGDSFTGNLSRAAGENANTYVISKGDLALNSNYTLNYTSAKLSINQAPLTVTAEDTERFAGTNNPTFTAKYSGFVNGESAAVFSSPVAFFTPATINSPMGNYDIVPSGAVANNYQITFVKGVLKVKAGAPTDVLFAGTTIYENQPSGTLAGELSSTSEDPTATFTYSLVSGSGDTENASFRIVGNQLLTAASLDYESKSTYSVRVKSTTQHGFSKEKTFTMNLIDVNESPTLDMIASKTICYTNSTQSIDLTGISAGPEAGQETKITISGSNPDLLQNLTVSGSGSKGTISYRVKNGASGISTITVTVKDNGGTDNRGVDTYSRTFVLTVNALPIIAISADKGINNNGNSTEVSKGETVVLSATGGSTYAWATHNSVINGLNTANLMVRPRETTTYTVTVTNANGCSEQKNFTINVLDDLQKIKATNILTPNGDGYNDRWIVDNIDLYPNNEVKIFDKSGRMIYGKKGYDNSWDGMLNGVPLTEGTYYYIIDFGKDRLKFKGFITIAREN